MKRKEGDVIAIVQCSHSHNYTIAKTNETIQN